ncbi:Aminotransferase class I/II-fold pyridoxal phosphate-dependent enzyme [Sulfidibacter corallicola]|uniref:Aminotransferase class I/II-fold pyridoxal phosphate-dependent enzyme n=1 Tax=Sulfidibacter corallicola TaxID=2818388 RepID=A0A8A4TTB8_SULCO|nr:GntG family PLP-dependent aldolase [Sulfidibacter corallicola]QTD52292.1 aminotransferase class I/II-fold pyridoxal phosphate-dependent enzyme [Sulfidibacter corallicola]
MATYEDVAFDFRSDTVTLPTPDMKAAMMEAEMGDDVYGEDPTVLALQDRIAAETGMEASLFFPTGSMANLVALMAQTEPGRQLYCGARGHVKLFELGSFASLAGLSQVDVPDTHGFLDLEQLQKVWAPEIYYMTQPGIVVVENTHNIGGGLIYPVEELVDLHRFTQEKGVPLHMDGARLWHAAVAQGRSLSTWTRHVESVMLSVSKGLGAPIGSVLAGSKAVIERALPLRKLLGGGMRQVGQLAAAALYALDHHLVLLARDHTRCQEVFGTIKNLPWLEAVAPQTNILIIHTERPEAGDLVAHLTERGLKTLAISPSTVRAVFHLNLTDEACERLADAIKEWGRTR